MHILVTGGTGFIGRALSAELLREGHEVSVLTRSRAAVPEAVDGVCLVERLAELEGVEAVVNLAGENLAAGRWTATRKQAFRRSRIEFTQNLLSWMAAQPKPPTVLVSGSAIGYYGPRDATAIDESAAPGSDFAAQLCRDWEAAAQAATALGLRVCINRIGIVLGRHGGALAKMQPAFRLGAGGPMGDGSQVMS